MNLRCLKCGCDITNDPKYFDYHFDWYCKECYEAVKQAENHDNKDRIRQLYTRHYKPSKIAQMLGYTVHEVYEVLQEKRKND